MSKLVPGVRPIHIPNEYNKFDFTLLFRVIGQQINDLSEGRIQARHNAQSTVPSGTAANYAVGDFVPDSNCTVQGSIAPGVAANYVRTGWICVAAGDASTPATFKEARFFTGS